MRTLSFTDQCAAHPNPAPRQLPAKRRQVIRLPKPPPAEWPKAPGGAKRRAPAAPDDNDGSGASEAEEGGDDEGDGGEGDGDGGGSASASGSGGGEPKHMSAAHRTGLAKASAVIDWLMTALGVRGGRGGGGGARRDDDDDGGEDGAAAGGTGGGGDHGPKVLVFAHHRTVMNRLAAALEGAAGYAPVGYVRIDGGTDPEDR